MMKKNILILLLLVSSGSFVHAGLFKKKRKKPCSSGSCSLPKKAPTQRNVSCEQNSCKGTMQMNNNAGNQNSNKKPDLVLYVGSGCGYCTKVTNFLNQNNLSITKKDVWSDSHAKTELLSLTGGKGQIPCLKIDGGYIHESDDIVRKLKEILL